MITESFKALVNQMPHQTIGSNCEARLIFGFDMSLGGMWCDAFVLVPWLLRHSFLFR